ncbi:hypothetical protein PV327_005797 [Microctonus hyperodae]|uniref:Uncharacterized protein n=1 Tax=Microctonus hyperodae TaxID=165561 RepID=A0AA39G2Y6_MICHY|nr:hypothetical protein PV327_005797 [Microctonus hyperodae]
MESMLAEQQSMRFPHRFPFEMELQGGANNLSLEEKALWAARSQILLRAAAAAAVGPYAQLVSPGLVYPGASAAGSSHQQQQHQHQQAQQQQQQQHQQQQQQLGNLWWASSLGPTLFAAAHHHHQQQQQLAATSAQQSPSGPAAPRPIYPSALALAHHRFSPYPTISGRKPTQPSASSPSASRRATPSPTDSLYREAQDLSPS